MGYCLSFEAFDEWKPLTITELKRFLGVTTFMGVAKVPHRADYWSRAFGNMPKGSLPLRRYKRNWLCLFFFLLDLSRVCWNMGIDRDEDSELID